MSTLRTVTVACPLAAYGGSISPWLHKICTYYIALISPYAALLVISKSNPVCVLPHVHREDVATGDMLDSCD